MFDVDKTNGAVTMHRGDTGAYKVHATRKSGTAWTSADRMILTVWNGLQPVLQRFYRLDDQWGLGDGIVQIEFHNEDTDKLPPGEYILERRYAIDPTWDLDEGVSIPTERVSNALTAGARIVDGSNVRVPRNGQTTLRISQIYGEV